jgi:hypothetical protein
MSRSLTRQVSRPFAIEPFRPRGSASRATRRRQLWVPESLEARVMLSGNPTNYTVNLTSDTGASSGMDMNTGDPSGDLLWAIEQANANANTAGSVIGFDFATAQTITLTSSLVLSEAAGPEVIDGPGASLLTVSGGNKVGVFTIAHGTATLSGLTISGGTSSVSGGAVYDYSSGKLTISDSTIEDNTAQGSGGGIFDQYGGALTISGSTIENNSAKQYGGGISDYVGGTLTVSDSAFENNTADEGGGIDNLIATAEVSDCTFEDNRATLGAGIASGGGKLTVVASTIGGTTSGEGNIAASGEGGGLYSSSGSVSLSNCTIANNSAGNGGGIVVYRGALTLTNSMVLDNASTEYGEGGGISVDGKLTVNGSTLSGNTAAEGGGIVLDDGTVNLMDTEILDNEATYGGGVFVVAGASGTLSIAGSTLSGNSGSEDGGGIAIFESGSTVTVTDSTLTANSAFDGAGIANFGQLAVANSTFGGTTSGEGNIASSGGGIQNFGDATANLTGCTFEENIAKQGGGGVANSGTLMASDCTFRQNFGSGSGGGVVNYGSAALSNCTIANNTAGYGGGIMIGGGALTLANSTVSGNTAPHFGGGLFNGATLAIAGSTVSDNTAASTGGGLFNNGPLTIINSTIAANTAIDGGGILDDYRSTGTIVNATIAYNVVTGGSGSGGGIDNTSGSTTTLDNTIVDLNTDGTSPGATADDIAGTPVAASSAYNLVGADETGSLAGGTGNQVGVTDPELGMLTSNGGPTETIAPQAGSPAINAGDNARAVDPQGNSLPYDQRGPGYPRILGGTVDIGAVESPATQQGQTIDFGPLDNQTYGVAPITLDATASSGLAVTFKVLSGPATVSGNVLTVTGVGLVDVEASQAGDPNYTPATSVDQPFTVDPANTTTTVTSSVNPSVVGEDVSFTATVVNTSGTAAGPQGYVQFVVGGTNLGMPVPLTDGMATITDDALTVGTYTIEADFSDPAGNFVSTGPGTLPGGQQVVDSPTVYTVDATTDSGAGSGDMGDLLYCVTQANTNSNPFGSKIEFDIPTSDPGYNPSTGSWTITLSGTLELGETAGPEVIDGPGASVVTISGGHAVSVFQVDDDVTATLSDLTISGGSTSYRGGGVLIEPGGDLTIAGSTIADSTATYYGGGVYNEEGTLSVTGSVFSDNSGSLGGAIESAFGSLTVSDSQFRDNSAEEGAGISSLSPAQITGCLFEGNRAVYKDGGIQNDSWMTVSSCTFSQNRAGSVGGGYGNTTSGSGSISDCTFSDNLAGYGGGIYVGSGKLTIANSTISDNQAGSGGGIFNFSGIFKVTDCILDQNTAIFETTSGKAIGRGGAISNYYGGSASISGCTISGNKAGKGGGIMVLAGTLTLTNSTVSDNLATINGTTPADDGGGIDNAGTLKITNSTIAGNSSSIGGGLYDDGDTTTIVNATIADNEATGGPDSGAGIDNISGSSTTLNNTIVAQNTDGSGGPADDIAGAGVSGASAYNLVGADETGSLTNGSNGNHVGVTDPGLGTLGPNGGPTQTISLLFGSPAINEGSNALIPAGITTDQRGSARIVGGTVDIGAFESPYLATDLGLTSSSGTTTYGDQVTITATVTSGGQPVTIGTVTFMEGSTILEGMVPLGADGTASFNISSLAAPTDTITAVYNGTSPFVSSEGSIQQTVNPASITTTVASAVNPSVDGEEVTFTAGVVNASGTPAALEGSVQFVVDGADLGGPVTLTDGTATSPNDALAAGSYTVEALFSDPAGNFISTGPGTLSGGQVVDPLTTPMLQAVLDTTSTPTIAAPANADLQSIIAAVNGLAAQGVPATITVDLGGGSFDDSTFSPPAGVTVVVVGNGTTTTFVGQSPALDVTQGVVIISGVTFTTATDAPTILVGGGSLTLRDDLIEESTGFTDAAISLTGGALDLGTATDPGGNVLNVDGLGEFVHNTTGYSVPATGDTFEVNGAPIAAPNLSFTALSSSSPSSVYELAVTFTATVRANTPETGMPGGSVDFVDTTTDTDLGSMPVVDGIASLTTSDLGAGSHLIRAFYSGDSNFTLSLDSLTQVISPAPLAVASIAPASPNPRNTAVSTIDVTFSVPVNTGSLSPGALTLIDDGGPNLINGGVSLSLVSGTTATYAIAGLAGLTAAQGDYTLTVNADDITDPYGNPGTGSLSTSWLMDTTAPTSHVVNALGTSQSSDTFPVPVSFSDPAGPGGAPASGVASVALYVSVNNGPFAWYQTQTLTTPAAAGTVTFTFDGQDRNIYAFHSIAEDTAGNVESKSSNAMEASTSVPDLHPPVTHVLSSSSYTNGVFTLNWSGTDPDQHTGTPAGSIAVVDIYVEIDGAAPTLIDQLNGGTPNGSGVYSGSMTYDALGDDHAHTYGFFSVGIDDEQKAQPQPASPDVTFSNITDSASLAVENLAVEKEIAERSFIQYLDVNFNQTTATSTALQALAAGLAGGSPSSYVELLWYGEGLNSDSTPQGSVNLFNAGTTASVSLTGNDLSINFGANGITGLLTETGASGTGSPTSSFGDGWYALGVDPTGDPTNGQVFWLPFFRLLGSATGDLTVSGPYTAPGTDAYTVYHAEGQTGTLMDADVNGDGAVNSKDLTETVEADVDTVGTTPPHNFPQFQLFAGSTATPANAVAVTQAQVQALLPAAIAAWQAAGLDAADVRELEGVSVQVGNLGTSILGLEAANTITINQTAAGFNWYVNANSGHGPSSRLTGPGGEAVAAPGSPAAGEVDLLTVLEHELGHVIGLSDNSEAGDLMDITLGLGVRRSPTAADLSTIAGSSSTPVPSAVGPTIDPQPVSVNGPVSVSIATVDAALAAIQNTAVGEGNDPETTVKPGSPAGSAGPVPGPRVTTRKKDQSPHFSHPHLSGRAPGSPISIARAITPAFMKTARGNSPVSSGKPSPN